MALACSDNELIITLFKELSQLYKKELNNNAACTYNKAAAALGAWPGVITEGKTFHKTKGTKLDGVGPKCCQVTISRPLNPNPDLNCGFSSPTLSMSLLCPKSLLIHIINPHAKPPNSVSLTNNSPSFFCIPTR